MSSQQTRLTGIKRWSRSSPLYDVVAAEMRQYDGSDPYQYGDYLVFRINVGTADKQIMESRKLDQTWSTCTPPDSEGFHRPGLWKHSILPKHILRNSEPWALWEYVEKKFQGQECQVLKVRKHQSKPGKVRWELVFVPPKAPMPQLASGAAVTPPMSIRKGSQTPSNRSTSVSRPRSNSVQSRSSVKKA